jgi:regulator of nucleoside diphosphate kinase
MHEQQFIAISAHDHDRLQAVMCTMLGARCPFADLLRRKLYSAVVMSPAHISSDVAIPGRRVRYIVDGERSEVRPLIWDFPGSASKALSLLEPRGLALLGLSVGQSISYRAATGRIEFLEIDAVFPDEADAVVLPESYRHFHVPADASGRGRTLATSVSSASLAHAQT